MGDVQQPTLARITENIALLPQAPAVENDPHCLAQLKHYRSFRPMAQEARRPVFMLKPADGAFGGHQSAVAAARQDFAVLARAVLAGIGVDLAEEAASS